jgi:ketosteroid isomerase-like protein
MEHGGPVYGSPALVRRPNDARGFRHGDGCRCGRRRLTLGDRTIEEDEMPATARKTTPAKTRRAANKTALRRAVDALNAGSPEDYLALFAPDAQLHGFPAGIEDLDALCRFHAATADTFPDASVTLDDAVSENDRVATRFTWRASQGPGWALEARGGAIVRFADGQIAECWNLPAEIHAVTS